MLVEEVLLGCCESGAMRGDVTPGLFVRGLTLNAVARWSAPLGMVVVWACRLLHPLNPNRNAAAKMVDVIPLNRNRFSFIFLSRFMLNTSRRSYAMTRLTHPVYLLSQSKRETGRGNTNLLLHQH